MFPVYLPESTSHDVPATCLAIGKAVTPLFTDLPFPFQKRVDQFTFAFPCPRKGPAALYVCMRVRSCEIGNRRTGKHPLPADGPSSSRWAIVHPAIPLTCPVRSVKPTPLIGSFRNPPKSLLLGSPRNPPQSCYSRGAGLTTLKREAGASTAPQPTNQIPKRP